MEFHHGWFMAIGLVLGLSGALIQFVSGFKYYYPLNVVLIGLGALILGWGTGRCDERACNVENREDS